MTVTCQRNDNNIDDDASFSLHHHQDNRRQFFLRVIKNSKQQTHPSSSTLLCVMMVRSMVPSSVLLLVLAFLAASSMAFTPLTVTSQTRGKVAFQPATFVKSATPMASQQQAAIAALTILRMTEQEKGTKSKIGADGTFYDDEVRNIKKGAHSFFFVVSKRLWCYGCYCCCVSLSWTEILVSVE
jgi:hypothetical protein